MRTTRPRGRRCAAAFLVALAVAGAGRHPRLEASSDPYGRSVGGVHPWYPGLHQPKMTPEAERLQNQDALSVTPLRVLSYNVKMLPLGASDHNGERAFEIADAIADLRRFDVMILQEVFTDDAYDRILLRVGPPTLAATHRVGDGYGGGLSDGGVMILSRWPIENTGTVNGETVVGNGSVFPSSCGAQGNDQYAAKGVIYARVVHPSGRRYHVFGTHLQAGDGQAEEQTRICQLQHIRNYIESFNLGPGERVVLGGDLNFPSGVGAPEYAALRNLGFEIPGATVCDRPAYFNPADAVPDCFARFTSDPLTNNFPPDGTARRRLDYVVYDETRWGFRNAINAVTRFQGSYGGGTGRDLSDHHGITGLFDEDLRQTPGIHVTEATATAGRFNRRFPVSTPLGFPAHRWATVLAGDFNADGRADLVSLDRPEPSLNNPTTVPVVVGIAAGQGNNSQVASNAWAQWLVDSDSKMLTGDFDKNGKTDLLVIDPPSGSQGPTVTNIEAALSTAALGGTTGGFSKSVWARWTMDHRAQHLVADFTGDGYADIAQINVPHRGWAPNDIWVGINRRRVGSNEFDTDGQPWAAGWSTSPTDMRVLVGDFDGDNKSDLLKIDLGSGACAAGGFWVGSPVQNPTNGIWSFTVKGAGKYGEWAVAQNCPDNEYMTGDFNADGLTDVAWVSFENGSPDAVLARTFYVGLAVARDGGRWAFQVNTWGEISASRRYKFLAADVDGDTAADLVVQVVAQAYVKDTLGAFVVHASQWTRLAPPVAICRTATGPCNTIFSSYDAQRLLSGDFNGDGRVDILQVPTP